MQWELANEDVLLPIQFQVDGQFVVPDADSVTLTVRNDAGVKFTGFDGLPVAVTLNNVLVTLPASINTLADGVLFGTRYVRIVFTSGGNSHSINLNYRIHHFLPILINESAVRGVVGADYEELPDEDIDIYGAYFDLLREHGAVISTALTAQDQAAISANRAITLKAALLAYPSLQTKLAKVEQENNTKRERMDVSFELLKMEITSALASEIATINSLVGGTTSSTVVPILQLISPTTDTITGS